MELLSVIRARSIWSVDLLELNPYGKKVDAELLTWLQGKYGFSKVPSSATDLDETRALAFLNGGFPSSEKVIIAFDLKIYSDGLVVDSRSSTEENDRFIDEMLCQVAKEIGLVYNPKLIQKKLYRSELNLRSKSDLVHLNPKLKALTKKISLLLNRDFDFSVIGFWSEQKPSEPTTQFRFERRLNTAFSEDRYYSTAPLQTQDHLALLRDLEDILAG